MSYINSVLHPFDTTSQRGPSDFYMPTSILDYKAILDTPTTGTYNWNTGTGTIAIFPSNSQG